MPILHEVSQIRTDGSRRKCCKHNNNVQICVGDKVFSSRFPCGEEDKRPKTRAYLGKTARYSARLETFNVIAGSTCATKCLHYQHEAQQNCCI